MKVTFSIEADVQRGGMFCELQAKLVIDGKPYGKSASVKDAAMFPSQWDRLTQAARRIVQKECDGLTAMEDFTAEAVQAASDPTKQPGYYCDVCPHAMALHNPDGTCPCGTDCPAERKAKGGTPA